MKEIRFVDIQSAGADMQEKVRLWRNTGRIRRSMVNQHEISSKEHAKWLDTLKNSESRKFWIVYVDQVPIGSVYLQDINYDDLSSEWGFYIGDERYLGQGLGKDILYTLLELVFEKMKLKVLITRVLSDNAQALSLYKKFDFIELDKLPYKNDITLNLLRFSREDWFKFKGEQTDGGIGKNRE